MSTSRPEFEPYGTEPTRPIEPYPAYEPTRSLELEPGYEPTRVIEPYGQPEPRPQPYVPYPSTAAPHPPAQQPWNGGYGGPPAGYGVPAVDPRWQYQVAYLPVQKSRVAAGLLGLFLGGLGIHNFYLGRTGVAVAQLLITLLSLGFLAPVVGVWALIESIMIFAGATTFRTDAKGIPLRD